MSNTPSFVSSSSDGDSSWRSEAEKAAQQAWHDEQVSRAFNTGAAYAIVRIFECGCHYVDRHAYQSSTAGREAAPYSTHTSVHDFCRGPCGKPKCANAECPDWWYTEEGQKHYGATDVEECEEIIKEVEKWEERIHENVENYRALTPRVKEMLHDMTNQLNLERLGWVLLYSPSWERRMLKEWCPELHDGNEWQRRAIDMAFKGAPRKYYEFCIDAAWESLKIVHSKVRDQLEGAILELQRCQSLMPADLTMPQEPVSFSTPDSPVSPRSLPKSKASTTATGTSFHSHFSRFSAKIVNTQTPDWESLVEYITPEELREPKFPEAQTSAGASPDHSSQSTRRCNEQLESQTSTSVLVIEAPEESPRESLLSEEFPDAMVLSSLDITSRLRADSDISMVDTPSPRLSLSVPEKRRMATIRPKQSSRRSHIGGTTKEAYSRKYSNLALPSQATAVLFDAFAGSESLSSWSSVSLTHQDTASISEPTRKESEPRRLMKRGELELVKYLPTSAHSSVSSFVDSPLRLDGPSSAAIFEPRPEILASSPSQTIADPRKRSRDDFEDEDNTIALPQPKKRIRYAFEDETNLAAPTHLGRRSRPSSLKVVPNYSSLRELVGTRIRKLTERYDCEPQDLSGDNVAPPGYHRTLTTTFLISSTLSADHPALDVGATSTTEISIPAVSVNSVHPTPADVAIGAVRTRPILASSTKSTTDKPESKGEVCKNSNEKSNVRGSGTGSGRRTVRDRLRGLTQLRALKLFQRLRSGTDSSKAAVRVPWWKAMKRSKVSVRAASLLRQ
ncbi:MAG: hypothetical protein Q9165_007363 [Trypethelium subeluteriae]